MFVVVFCFMVLLACVCCVDLLVFACVLFWHRLLFGVCVVVLFGCLCACLFNCVCVRIVLCVFRR